MSNVYLHPTICHDASTMRLLCTKHGADVRADSFGRAVLIMSEAPINEERHGNECRQKVPLRHRQYVGVDLPTSPDGK